MSSFTGTSGPDSLVGGTGADQLSGLDGADTLNGGGGPDTIYGGTGDDLIVFTTTASSAVIGLVDGGTGTDTLDLTGLTGPITTVANQPLEFQAGGVTFDVTGVEVFRLGDGGANVSFANAPTAPVLVYGGAARDTLTGGAGSDQLYGGAGSDVAVLTHSSGSYTVHMDGGTGTVSGGPDSAVGHLTSVETVSFYDGKLNFDPDSAAAQVYRLYEAAFGRAPDFYGEAAWTNELEQGLSLQRLTLLFTSGAEFQALYSGTTNEQFVEQLYHTALHRDADPGGLQNWTTMLDAGTVTRTQLVGLFAEGDEHRALTADAIANGIWTPDPIYEDVEFVYQAAFGRAADEGGLLHWGGEIEAGRLSFHDLVVTATQSQEFLDATRGLNHGQLVDYLYETALGRAADPAGHDALTAQLDAGKSVAELVFAFAQSSELQGDIQPRLEHADWFVS